MDLSSYSLFLHPKVIMVDEEKVIHKAFENTSEDSIRELFSHMKERAEQLYLDGNVGRLRLLCVTLLEKRPAYITYDECYWIYAYLFKYIEYPLDFYILKEYCKTEKEVGFYQLLIISINSCLQEPLHMQEAIDIDLWSKRFKKRKDMFKAVNNDLPTQILIMNLIELRVAGKCTDIEKLIDLLKEYLAIDLDSIEKKFKLICIQKEILSGQSTKEQIENGTKDILVADYERLFAVSWLAYFQIDYLDEKMDRYLYRMADEIVYENEYSESVQALASQTKIIRDAARHIKDIEIGKRTKSEKKDDQEGKQNKEFYEDNLDSYVSNYRIQMTQIELPLSSFQTIRHEDLEQRVGKLQEKFNFTRFTQLLSTSFISEMDALRNWNLTEYHFAKNMEARLFRIIGTKISVNQFAEVGYACAQSIIATIESCDSEAYKNGEECVEILEKYGKDYISQVFHYIFYNCPTSKCLIATKWLELLTDDLPENMIDALIVWTQKYEANKKNKNVKNDFDIGDLKYLKPIISEFKLSEAQWEALKEILIPYCTNMFWVRVNTELTMTVLKHLQWDESLEIVKDWIEKGEELSSNKARLINALLQIGGKSAESIKYCQKLFDIAYENTNDEDYIIYSKIVGMDEQMGLPTPTTQMIQNKIYKKFDIFNISSGMDSGFTDSQIDDVIYYNWQSKDSETIINIVNKILDFLYNYNGELSSFYVSNAYKIIHSIGKNVADKAGTEILSLVLEHSRWKAKYSDSSSGIRYGRVKEYAKEEGELLTFAKLLSIANEYQLYDIMKYVQKLMLNMPKAYMYYVSYILFAYQTGKSEKADEVVDESMELMLYMIHHAEEKEIYLEQAVHGFMDVLPADENIHILDRKITVILELCDLGVSNNSYKIRLYTAMSVNKLQGHYSELDQEQNDIVKGFSLKLRKDSRKSIRNVVKAERIED